MANPETRPKYFPRILHIDEVGSTNVEAMRLAMFGETGPVWIRAIRQTEGKGRSGRQWMSEPGNLFASLLMRLTAPAPKAYQLSLVTGVAVIEAVREAVQFASDTEYALNGRMTFSLMAPRPAASWSKAAPYRTPINRRAVSRRSSVSVSTLLAIRTISAGP